MILFPAVFGLLARIGSCTSVPALAQSSSIPTVSSSVSAGAITNTISTDALQRALHERIIRNDGQIDEEFTFVARTLGGFILGARDGFTVVSDKLESDLQANRSVLRFTLEGGNPSSGSGQNPAAGAIHYFTAKRPEEWLPSIDSFREWHQPVAPGVDLRFYLRENAVEYDIVAESPSVLQSITIRVDGGLGLQLSEAGDLLIETASGTFQQQRPSALIVTAGSPERRIPCKVEFVGSDRFRFRLEGADPKDRIRVDPVLLFSTLFGGSSAVHSTAATAVRPGSGGTLFLCGSTNSITLPVTPGAMATSYGGGFGDAFIAKLAPAATALSYATYVGGTYHEVANTLEVLAGDTATIGVAGPSTTLPTTPNAILSWGSNVSGYVLRLNGAGSAPLFASFLDSGIPNGTAITVSHGTNSDSLYLSGSTGALGFPVSPGAFQTSVQGFYTDTFVLRVNTASGLVEWGTLVGGTSLDQLGGMAVDSLGNVYISGGTSSVDFPATAGAFDPIPPVSGESKTFLVSIPPGGSSLNFATFQGAQAPPPHNADSGGNIVGVSNTGVYTAGYIPSGFPVTAQAVPIAAPIGGLGALQFGFTGQLLGATFIVPKISTQILQPLIHTGVTAADGQVTLLVQAGTNFPLTPNALDKTLDGPFDLGLIRVDSTLTGILYGSYLGGSKIELGGTNSLHQTTDGTLYIAGRTTSPDFPTSAGAYDAVMNTSQEAFVLGMTLPSEVAGTAAYGSGTAGCSGQHKLWATTPPRLGTNPFRWACTEAPANSLGLLIVSDVQDLAGGDPLFLGVALHVGLFSPSLFGLDMPSNASGLGLASYLVPNSPALLGQTIYSQAIWQWTGGPCTPSPYSISTSNGMAITVLP